MKSQITDEGPNRSSCYIGLSHQNFSRRARLGSWKKIAASITNYYDERIMMHSYSGLTLHFFSQSMCGEYCRYFLTCYAKTTIDSGLWLTNRDRLEVQYNPTHQLREASMALQPGRSDCLTYNRKCMKSTSVESADGTAARYTRP